MIEGVTCHRRMANRDYPLRTQHKLGRDREGIAVARCADERLMRRNKLRGAVRSKHAPLTTVADEAAARPVDLLRPDFTADPAVSYRAAGLASAGMRLNAFSSSWALCRCRIA